MSAALRSPRDVLERVRSKGTPHRSASRAIDASLSGTRSAMPGYVVGDHGRCPNCGHGGMIVGRTTVECGNCGTPQPLLDTPRPLLDRKAPERMTPVGALIDWVRKL